MKCVCCNQTIRAKDNRITFNIGAAKLTWCIPCERADLPGVFLKSYGRIRYKPDGATYWEKEPGASKAAAQRNCQFVIDAGRILASAGAVWDREQSHTGCRVYDLSTPCGPLELHVYGQNPWIAGRFTSHTGGTLATRGQSNRSSGKWNHFFYPRDNGADYQLPLYADTLARVVRFQPTADQRATIDAEIAAAAERDRKWAAYFAEREVERQQVA